MAELVPLHGYSSNCTCSARSSLVTPSNFGGRRLKGTLVVLLDNWPVSGWLSLHLCRSCHTHLHDKVMVGVDRVEAGGPRVCVVLIYGSSYFLMQPSLAHLLRETKVAAALPVFLISKLVQVQLSC